ncbi:hypothetical protein EV360DRAFT_90710, partial [Lentinula raphanica]
NAAAPSAAPASANVNQTKINNAAAAPAAPAAPPAAPISANGDSRLSLVSGQAAPLSAGANSETSPLLSTTQNTGSPSADKTSGVDAAAPVAKKKRSEMGAAERAAYCKASAARAEKLNVDLEDFHLAQESMMSKIAEDNEISVQRVKRLVYHTTQSSKKKKASDHNVLVFIKSQEVNAGRAKGSREPLKRLHELVKEDEELQEMAEDSDAMAQLREQYDRHQEEKKLKSIRISKTVQARMVASKINELQENATFMAEAADVASFGLVVRGSFESTVTSSFWGHGPVDEFFRKTFNKGVQDVLDLFQAYVCTAEKMGTRKLYQSEMLAEIVRLISQGLRETTGVSDLSMSYSKYDKLIVVPYKVRLLGWPEDVPFSYPHKLHAEEIKTLYDSLASGVTHWQRMAAFEYRHYLVELEKSGKLDSQHRAQHSDTGRSHRKRQADDDDNSDDNNDDNDARRASKKPKSAHSSKRAEPSEKTAGSSKAGTMQTSSKKGKTTKKVVKKASKKTATKVDKGKGKGKGKGKAVAKGKSKRFIVNSDEDEAEFSDNPSDSDNDDESSYESDD